VTINQWGGIGCVNQPMGQWGGVGSNNQPRMAVAIASINKWGGLVATINP